MVVRSWFVGGETSGRTKYNNWVNDRVLCNRESTYYGHMYTQPNPSPYYEHTRKIKIDAIFCVLSVMFGWFGFKNCGW